MSEFEPLKMKALTMCGDSCTEEEMKACSEHSFFWEKDVVSAAKWYLKYRDREDLFKIEEPVLWRKFLKEECDDVPDEDFERKYLWHNINILKNWLFSVAFADVLKGEKHDRK